ncbi:glycosyl hydrolase family 18 protein [Citricoccus sp. NPDC055426]|uniref:glycosyl hydrolase family 18 protein n=1 Tax=Citricoccus sp. NPDC055426 TaxID=3155536 RepID=UPI003446DCA4
MVSLPQRVVAGYWTSWGSPLRLTEIPPQYNTVFLFHATPVGGAPGSTGAVQWSAVGDGRGAATHFTADLAQFRRNRTAILTVGGSRQHVDLSTRLRAQTFLDSIKRIYGELGGFDGLDWNNYEGEQQPDTDQMIWISQQLKTTYGQDFAITSPPAPWRPADVRHCKAMIDAGVLDMVSPQYYDGPGLADEKHIVESVNEWVAIMGDSSRVGVGVGLANATNYSTHATVEGAWKTLAGRHPQLRGAFNWNISTDERMGWPFANYVGPLMMKLTLPATMPPLTVPPIIPVFASTLKRDNTEESEATSGDIAENHGMTDK